MGHPGPILGRANPPRRRAVPHNLLTGLIASILVWLSWNKLGKTRPFHAVDDALGVVHTTESPDWPVAYW